MWKYALFVLCFLINGYSGEITTEISENSTDLPIVISETEISRDNDGLCTFEVK